MADENQNQIVEENQTEGLMGGVSTEEPKTPDPNETEIPHKEEEKAEDKTYENEKQVKLEKPEYIEDKFWDPERGVKTEELSNSYSELQNLSSMYSGFSKTFLSSLASACS